jgi:quercetin dioxygenase-like cupin family protein
MQAIEMYGDKRGTTVKVLNYREVTPDTEVRGVALHTVISGEEAPRFSMRVFEVSPGSATPFHIHDWEHEVFVLSGRGKVRSVDGEREVAANDAVFVAPGEEHCFVNIGDDPFRFVCCIPNSAHAATADPPIACNG